MYVHNHKGTARVAATLLKGYSAEAWPSELGARSRMRQSSLGNQLSVREISPFSLLQLG
jgi:hypothetical protein